MHGIMAYTHLMRPMHHVRGALILPDVNALENQMVQRRAARWVTSNYDWRSAWNKHFIYFRKSSVANTFTEKADIKA